VQIVYGVIIQRVPTSKVIPFEVARVLDPVGSNSNNDKQVNDPRKRKLEFEQLEMAGEFHELLDH